MLCVEFDRNWPSGSEEDFLISSMYFCYCVIISPLKRAWLFIWTKLYPLHTRMLCAKFGWNWPSGSGEFFFLNFVDVLFCYYLPLECVLPFIWTNVNPIHPKMLWTKFGSNWLSGSGEEDNKFHHCYFPYPYFAIISPW